MLGKHMVNHLDLVDHQQLDSWRFGFDIKTANPEPS